MGTYKIAIYYSNKAEMLEELDSPPEGCLTTTRRLGNLGFLRVYASVISPQPEESQDDLPLSYREAENIVKTITDIIISLDEKLRR